MSMSTSHSPFDLVTALSQGPPEHEIHTCSTGLVDTAMLAEHGSVFLDLLLECIGRGYSNEHMLLLGVGVW